MIYAEKAGVGGGVTVMEAVSCGWQPGLNSKVNQMAESDVQIPSLIILEVYIEDES